MSFHGNTLHFGHKPASYSFYIVSAYVLQPYSSKLGLRANLRWGTYGKKKTRERQVSLEILPLC